ncbi:abhydrolase domain-containing protein 16B [Platysternon megacephalum]|uniref:Abhydrolase domain-containing protein 16B n=1 Tax=Platysternon megacephalum TaxID=55544 RepID=A0A4D9EIC5_9SAUR|nr:abhydrolase domain-containing protein 16B [Platysternon megacephalum]
MDYYRRLLYFARVQGNSSKRNQISQHQEISYLPQELGSEEARLLKATKYKREGEQPMQRFIPNASEILGTLQPLGD